MCIYFNSKCTVLHRVLRKLRPKTRLSFRGYENQDPLTSNVKIWSQIVTEIGLICQIIFCPILSTEFRSNLMVNLGLLVFVILKTKTLPLSSLRKLTLPTKQIRKICMKSNYDRSKTVIRKTTKNYHLRADDPLLLKIWTHISTEALRRGWKATDYLHWCIILHWKYALPSQLFWL